MTQRDEKGGRGREEVKKKETLEGRRREEYRGRGRESMKWCQVPGCNLSCLSLQSPRGLHARLHGV